MIEMQNIKDIIETMTIEEKLQLLTFSRLLNTKGYEKYDIPEIEMADGPYGVRGLNNNQKDIEGGNVCYPVPATMACSWNREIAENFGQAMAEDCKRNSINVSLSPATNLKRSPLCGRNFEYLSEDPELSGELAAAYIEGMQKNGVAACIKHFTANNQEENRTCISSEIDERTLRELYLRPFEIAVKKSNPACIMSAYNKLNSIFCSENKWLLTDILKNEWGFNGMVVSDWGATHNIVKSIAAGMDMKMPSDPAIVDDLKKGLDEGKIHEERINDACERILSIVFKYSNNNDSEKYSREKNHAIAQKIAEESIILLKNENNILPLDKNKIKKIAIIGSLAEKPVYMGGGSSIVAVDEKSIESPLEYIKKLAGDIEINYNPVYANNCTNPNYYCGASKKTAAGCDVAFVFIGDLLNGTETEGYDRYNIDYEPFLDDIIKGASASCNDVVLIMQNACVKVPRVLPKQVKAIIHMGICGEAGGSALANIIFGLVNPSGKTAETFMKNNNRCIDFPGDGKKVIYNERWQIGYRYYDQNINDVWFPFGYGLSYTKFEYSNLVIEQSDHSDKNFAVRIQFDVKNVGKTQGKEIVQLYVGNSDSTISRPKKELKQFDKISLLEGETKTVKFLLDSRAFATYNTCLHDWNIENGEYQILIGSSSQDIHLKGTVIYNDIDNYSLK